MWPRYRSGSETQVVGAIGVPPFEQGPVLALTHVYFQEGLIMGNRKHLLFSSALTLGLFASFGAMAQERFSCPQQGGDLVVGLEAAAGTLDQQTATSSATRNI